VDAGVIDAVIVLALDRIGRKTRLVLELVERLAGASVVLVSCKESLDASTGISHKKSARPRERASAFACCTPGHKWWDWA
jgi:hypothetical protein